MKKFNIAISKESRLELHPEDHLHPLHIMDMGVMNSLSCMLSDVDPHVVSIRIEFSRNHFLYFKLESRYHLRKSVTFSVKTRLTLADLHKP